MLQSGIKASMAIRVYGDDLEGLSKASLAVAKNLKQNHYVNAGTVNPDIVMGKPYYEFEVDREEAARYGMTTMMVNQIVSAGLGGIDVTTTVEGRERYPIQVCPWNVWQTLLRPGGQGRLTAKMPVSLPTSHSLLQVLLGIWKPLMR